MMEIILDSLLMEQFLNSTNNLYICGNLNSMKKLIFILFLFFLSICSYAQTIKFQAEVVAYKFGEAPWTEWEKNHDIIIMDLTNGSIFVKGDEYAIASNYEQEELEDKISLVFVCLLGGKDKYYVEIVIYKKQKIRHLYIRGDNRQIVYQIMKI